MVAPRCRGIADGAICCDLPCNSRGRRLAHYLRGKYIAMRRATEIRDETHQHGRVQKGKVMNHGQFYKADKLVEAVHKNAGGMFAGFRGAHAFGRIYKGTFTPTSLAKTLSRAAHFQDVPVPVTARFSGVSGDPNQKPANVVAMATKFYLHDGTSTDLIGITLPAFFAGTPEEFFGLEEARDPDPATGKPDMKKLQAYLANHPNAARVVQALQSQLAPVSLAQTSFRTLHAYRFSNAVEDS